MIGCLRTRVRKQPIIALYFEFETVPKDQRSQPKKESSDQLKNHLEHVLVGRFTNIYIKLINNPKNFLCVYANNFPFHIVSLSN